MDNFREWLSDNLRYILLGLGIILVLLILFFGVRFISGRLGSTQTADTEAVAENAEDADDDAETEDAAVTDEAEDADEAEKAEVTEEAEEETEVLTVTDNAEVTALIEAYYTALGSRDTETLKTLVDTLSESEENAIANTHYIEGYTDVETYTKDGATETSYVVIAAYNHTYVGYPTQLPGVSCLYVDTDENGALYIVAEPTEEQQTRIDSVLEEEDVQNFLSEKQTAYEETLAGDEALASYLEGLGIEGTSALEAEVGTVLTVAENCKVRAQASADSEELGKLIGGQEVTKTGQEGDWVQIDFNGQTGYVRGDLFQ